MILIIDNYDSFTYNLYQLMGELHEDMIIKRNDEISIQEIKKINPENIVISPGPGRPENKRDFGICTQVIQKFGNVTPILGVCLGHQGIFNAFGGEIIRTEPMHGKTSQIFHTGDNIFKGVKNPLTAARYHSLVCNSEKTRECIEIIARTSEGMIMAIKHNINPIVGLQFHPESVGTPVGRRILKNFLEM